MASLVHSQTYQRKQTLTKRGQTMLKIANILTYHNRRECVHRG